MEKRIFEREPFDRRSAWCWLIEHAMFAGANGLQRGQLRSSMRKLGREWGWPEAKVRRYLSAAQNAEMIRCVTDAGNTLITICNYEKYQVLARVADALPDAEPTHDRRVTDAHNKEGKKEEGKDSETLPENPSPTKNATSRRNGEYAFCGKLVRLNQENYNQWRKAYHGIADLDAALTTLDDYYDGRLEGQERRNWFIRCSKALEKEHQKALAARQEPLRQFTIGVG